MARHVIVSGGSKGLGEGIVRALLTEGYAVSTFSRSPTPFVERATAEFPDRFHAARADLGDRAGLKRFVAEASKRHGPVWGLVNNAAIAHEGLLATMPDAHIDQLLMVNVAGTLALTRACARGMLLARGGRIVSITSIVGLRGFRGLAVYGAAKAALDSASRALARELGPIGVTVNTVAPGFIETDMSASLDPDQKARIVARTPLGRLGTADDVASVVSFLLSDRAAFVTGQTIAVDGGGTV